MAKNAKELSQVKARQTKLGKKNSDELIQIILKKDKVERNLNNQIKSLKAEVNTLSTRVNNFDKDMEGTYQALETYKDKVNVLIEQNDELKINNSSLKNTYDKDILVFTKALELWKRTALICAAVAAIGIIVGIML